MPRDRFSSSSTAKFVSFLTEPVLEAPSPVAETTLTVSPIVPVEEHVHLNQPSPLSPDTILNVVTSSPIGPPEKQTTTEDDDGAIVSGNLIEDITSADSQSVIDSKLFNFVH